MPDLAPLELQCFGPPTARVSGQDAPREVLWHKHLALLVYLALSPDHTRTREHLVGLLWPEKRDKWAKHSLTEALSRLRDPLGKDRFTTTRDAVTLAPAALDVDALRFEALAGRDPEAGAALARGAFLEGFSVAGAPAFEEWATERRAHYYACLAAALLAVAERALSAPRYADAAAAARRALTLQPYAEPAITLLMRATALSGDVAAAMAAFHDFTARLAAEVHEQPSRALTALAERVRVAREQPAPQRAATPAPLPLIGREALHRAVFGLVAEGSRAGGPRVLLIVGDPGTGKTRLLTECMERLALEGATVVRTRPLDSDQDVPWSTLRALLRSGLLNAPGGAAADPGALQVLGGLVPQLGHGVTRPERGDVAQVAAALASLLRALAEERPVGIAVCDAQFGDGSSLDALGAALTQAPGAHIVTVLTTSPTWDELPAELLRLRSEIGRSLPGLEVQLEPLSEAETRQLVFARSSWCAGDAERARLARRVYFETSGNPFLVTTLLRALADASPFRAEVLAWPPPGATDDSPLPISVPQLARRAITARIARLDQPTQRVLQAATIGSAAIDVALVVVVTGLSRQAVEVALTTLEHARLVTFQDGRYSVAAPLIAQVVLAEWLLPGERRTLRERAIAALVTRTDIESRLLCARLSLEVTPGPAACDAALAVAEAALAAGMSRAARQALAAAHRGLPSGDDARRRALEQLRSRLAT